MSTGPSAGPIPSRPAIPARRGLQGWPTYTSDEGPP